MPTDRQFQLFLVLTFAIAAAAAFAPACTYSPASNKIPTRSSQSMLSVGRGAQMFRALIMPLAFGPSGLNRVLGSSRTLMSAAGEGTGVSVCYITVPNAEEADKLAGKLVESKLAACVNVIPGVQSVYTWQGKVEKDNELLLMVKTRTELTDKLSIFVKQHHPYDVPVLISNVPVAELAEAGVVPAAPPITEG